MPCLDVEVMSTLLLDHLWHVHHLLLSGNGGSREEAAASSRNARHVEVTEVLAVFQGKFLNPHNICVCVYIYICMPQQYQQRMLRHI